MSFDVCKTFLQQKLGKERQVSAVSRKKLFKYYSAYAWGFPTLIVSVAHLADQLPFLEDYMPAYAGYKNYPGNQLCWINNRLGLGMFFALPVASLVLENTLLFIVTLVCLFYRYVA